MQTRIVNVYPGVPTVVDAVLAGVRVQAEWVGAPPKVGGLVDVELDVDAVLEWADGIIIDDRQSSLREGPVLRGTVEMQDQEILTVRVAEMLVQVEITDGSVDVALGSAIALPTNHLKLCPTGV